MRRFVRYPSAWRYAAIGTALGVAAPAGLLLLRLATAARGPLPELRTNSVFYLYTLAGTCVVFGIFGYFAGRQTDRLRRSRDRYETLSRLDTLTHLLNARAFQGRYRRALEHAEHFSEPISLLIVDVDGLKSINDRFGHTTGSAALRHVAQVLRESKREEDDAARWGGDEFALLMPGADRFAAARLAETLVSRVKRAPISPDHPDCMVTVTVGAATAWPPSSEDLFELADLALYQGKQAGRDRYRLTAASERAAR
jgi:diguanylate cyclase (GGDEF)-like protein